MQAERSTGERKDISCATNTVGIRWQGKHIQIAVARRWLRRSKVLVLLRKDERVPVDRGALSNALIAASYGIAASAKRYLSFRVCRRRSFSTNVVRRKPSKSAAACLFPPDSKSAASI